MGSFVSPVSLWLGSAPPMMELSTGAMQGFWEGGMRPICVFQAPAVPPTGTHTVCWACCRKMHKPRAASVSAFLVWDCRHGLSAEGGMRTALWSLSSYTLLPVMVRGTNLLWGLHKLVSIEWVVFKSHLLSTCPEISAKTSITWISWLQIIICFGLIVLFEGFVCPLFHLAIHLFCLECYTWL